MSNRRRRSRNVDATLNMLAKTVVRAEGRCLAVAENKVLLEFNNARSVTVENVDIKQVADASVDCTQTVNVRAGSTLPDVERQMQRLVKTANSTGGKRVKVVEDVTQAITRNSMKSCMATAINDFEAAVADVGGDVRVADLKIDQMAEARIRDCLMSDNVRVGDVPLREYLAMELPKYTLDDSVLREAPPCPLAMAERASAGYTALGSGLGLAVLLVLVYVVWRAQRRR